MTQKIERESCQFTFECFLVRRFLELFNKQNNANYECLEKRDERVRNESSYDYRCQDQNSDHELRVELKRMLEPNKIRFENSIDAWFRKNVFAEMPTQVQGKYFIAFLYDKPIPLKINNRLLNALFKDIKTELQKVIIDMPDSIDLNTSPKSSLIKLHNEGRDLSPWIEYGENSDRNHECTNRRGPFLTERQSIIEQNLENAGNKFHVGNGRVSSNIVLLIDKAKSIATNELRSLLLLLEVLEPGKNLMKDIDEVYNLSLWRKPVIARIFPLKKTYSSELFIPENYMDKETYAAKCIDFFKSARPTV